MNKLKLLIFIFISSFVLISCSFNDTPVDNSMPPPPDNNVSTDIPPAINDTGSVDSSEMSWSIDTKVTFDSIKDAISKWLSLKCIYKDNSDNSETVAYIKGDSIAMSWDNGSSWELTPTWIIKWDTIYMWNNGEWLKLDLSSSPEDSVKIWKQSIRSQADLLDILNTQKDNCIQEDISDSKFGLPEWIEFKELKNSDTSWDNGSGN